MWVYSAEFTPSGDVDQSEFEHACRYDNDLCQEYEYAFFVSFKNRVINIITLILCFFNKSCDQIL